LPEGVIGYGDEVYVQERNTEDVVAFKVQGGGADGRSLVTQDGPAFSSLSADPMPANLRLGQKLFYSANSDDVPITQNHWVACATCHLEGRSDAVTWLFATGPARHAHQRGRPARYRVSLPDRRSLEGAGLLEDDRRRAGRRLRA
jgi:hypothetical protein